MIAIVTDSASMLPASLRTRYGIVVVPLTITINGREYADGVDLAIGDFYERLTGGAVVTTAAPSPGSFVDAYRSAAAAGAEAVLSVHTGAAYSATVGSATVAAGLVDIPVTIVDTEVASFPVALAIWSAADALREGRPSRMPRPSPARPPVDRAASSSSVSPKSPGAADASSPSTVSSLRRPSSVSPTAHSRNTRR